MKALVSKTSGVLMALVGSNPTPSGKFYKMLKIRTELPSNKEIHSEILNLIEKEKIFFLLTGNSIDQLIKASELIKEHGFNLIGFDFKIQGAKDKLKDYKKTKKKEYGVFGISTKKEARIAINAGARFIFSNNFDKGIIRRCKKEKVFHAIGSITPTEVYNSYDFGAESISLYPCNQFGGIEWFEFIQKNFPKTKLIPTDIITAEETESYLKASRSFAVAFIIDLRTEMNFDELINKLSH